MLASFASKHTLLEVADVTAPSLSGTPAVAGAWSTATALSSSFPVAEEAFTVCDAEELDERLSPMRSAITISMALASPTSVGGRMDSDRTASRS